MNMYPRSGKQHRAKSKPIITQLLGSFAYHCAMLLVYVVKMILGFLAHKNQFDR